MVPQTQQANEGFFQEHLQGEPIKLWKTNVSFNLTFNTLFCKKKKLMMKIWRVYSNVHAKSWKCDQYLPE